MLPVLPVSRGPTERGFTRIVGRLVVTGAEQAAVRTLQMVFQYHTQSKVAVKGVHIL